MAAASFPASLFAQKIGFELYVAHGKPERVIPELIGGNILGTALADRGDGPGTLVLSSKEACTWEHREETQLEEALRSKCPASSCQFEWQKTMCVRLLISYLNCTKCRPLSLLQVFTVRLARSLQPLTHERLVYSMEKGHAVANAFSFA